MERLLLALLTAGVVTLGGALALSKDAPDSCCGPTESCCAPKKSCCGAMGGAHGEHHAHDPTTVPSALGAESKTTPNASAIAIDPKAVPLDKPIPTVPTALPPNPPNKVRFGAIFVTYAGADDAPAGARTKKAAEEHVERLAHMAQADWKAALSEGDKGSDDDFGRVKLGELEGASERAVFSLGVGEVSGIVKNDRGFWIYRRNE